MHSFTLKEPYFSFIKNGSKRIELKLYDERRKNIKLGDKIIFVYDQDLKQNNQHFGGANLHNFTLKEPYFSFIKNGSKRIELRLYDEKRKSIKLGDKIIFVYDQDPKQSITAKVTGLLRYPSFKEILTDFDIEVLADKTISKDDLLNDLNLFYTKEEQDKYGILGIKIELLKEEN